MAGEFAASSAYCALPDFAKLVLEALAENEAGSLQSRVVFEVISSDLLWEILAAAAAGAHAPGLIRLATASCEGVRLARAWARRSMSRTCQPAWQCWRSAWAWEQVLWGHAAAFGQLAPWHTGARSAA